MVITRQSVAALFVIVESGDDAEGGILHLVSVETWYVRKVLDGFGGGKEEGIVAPEQLGSFCVIRSACCQEMDGNLVCASLFPCGNIIMIQLA